MEITRTTVAGAGILHDCLTRDGQHVRVLVEKSGIRRMYVYCSAEPTAPMFTEVVLDHDEADQLADILHSTPIPDRMANLERRLSEMTGGAR